MDEQLQHLIDDCQRKRQAAHEAETRLWRRLAEVHDVEPHTPAPPRLPTDARRKQRLVICGVAGAVLVAVLTALPLIFRGREAQAYARIDRMESTDPEVVGQHAAAKLHRAGLYLSGCLNPLDELRQMKRGGQLGLEAIGDMQTALYGIYDHLPININRHETTNDSTRVPLLDGHDNRERADN